MFAYLSKKIAIPNNKKLKSIAWSKEHGYIACGGEDGLMKILKLEVQVDCKSKGLAAPTNLVMNQTLEGHTGSVKVLAWNEKFKKITTSDQQGLIIVWMLYKGSWYEEMINNRNKSVVCSMQWDTEGHRICIAYEDGAAILGSVDGNRIWGKELKCGNLVAVEWSPDGKLLLFGLVTGEIFVYDYLGNFLSKVPIYCLNNIHGAVRLTALHWYRGERGYAEPNCPTLAVCYDIGRCQLMRNQNDSDPILLDTGIEVSCAAWNENGSLLAIGGSHKGHISSGSGSTKTTERDVNIVQFYNALGDHLRSLYVPGKCLSACAWEGNGSLRLAMAVDSFIYFANLRPNYKWAYCDKAHTIVYSYTRAGSPETFVVFWNTKKQQTRIRTVNHLMHICAAEDYACLVCKNEDSSATHTLTLCNALGVSIGSKRIQIEPTHVVMTNNQVITVNKDMIYAWQFFNPKNLIGMRSALTPITSNHHEGSERLCHIDNASGADESVSGRVSSKGIANWDVSGRAPSTDPICAVAVGGRRQLFVARASGQVKQYRLPDLWLEGTVKTTDSKPYRMQVNCDSSLLAIIDDSGLLTFHAVKGESGDSSDLDRKQLSTILRKDVWDFKFSEVLRDCETIFDHEGSVKALEFIEANSHPRLKRLLSERSLEQQNLDLAELGFVQCQDYAGIQFVKRLRNIQSKVIRKAEIKSYFGQVDDAEQILMTSDRSDLAIELRRRLGDWFRVAQLVKDSGALVKDADLAEIWKIQWRAFVIIIVVSEAVNL
ncbi:WD repeat-containing protein 35 [Fasciola gigantica]|uniref:WD repeat-containing protein 35 n=1 Tax=Fasciola gigantica TaxID=46835 RepID=A0A504YDQ9_FASGI|nr:WD repeat-containing protein 35 [Fasciola gigantica]